ncbi:putative ribonuclease toxin of YeeF-YezG toxin-antitoxin module [Gracilibacillus halotolerans]|uniref:Putative ribonuclease toxin of YeeF-YezG toxin-antitoxin module n=1 Tax=Gracilibacillus halotolerans TaxID=74386 RepID=A0A841RHB5_9BACI|nr:deaminase domain-containing protein [Gracilibacillus halotolerans]MBB6512051.1 putative ribonuclease toxin of YeeF-YezG toxin-antitoxin module [Gracilibacillus halotolerans]
MSNTQTLETKTLVEAMESRAKEYNSLRIQFRELKTSFHDIINLDDFKGKTAESVKGFYRAQIDVVDAWLDFIDLQEAFFKGIKGIASDMDLGEDTLVHLPFLDSDLKNSETRARQIVDGQEQALDEIFSGISDIVSLEPYSTSRFDDRIDKATKTRKETKEKVDSLDQMLVEHYEQSEYHENIIAGLISELYQASMQGGEVNPLYFNEDTYRNSDIHTAKEKAKKITADYISWQDDLEKARELKNRSFGEKTWDTICTFTGEVTGYYDMKRATTGIDPVTGEELTDGQRATAATLAAAGFIPFVGWAGRAVKGGHAIYKTSKTFKAADNALDAYRTTEAFDILRKTEYGLYGLASANGFSEYITGKDMFGEELTEQQRQSSLTQSILLLAAGGGSVAVDRVQAKNSVNHIFPTPTPPATNPGIRMPWMVTKAFDFMKKLINMQIPTPRFVQDSMGNKYLVLMKSGSGGGGNTVKRTESNKQDTLRQVETSGTGKVYPTRQIDSVTEAHIIDRVKELRGNLSSKYKKSGNFAVAEVDVSGISKSEFYAQSSINELKGSLEHKVPDISLQPENPMFKATEAVGKNGFNYLRNTDTEYKILNDIASRLGDNTQASGRIKLFTELDTCDSCNKVIAEFAAKYKNIELEVVHNNGNRIIP